MSQIQYALLKNDPEKIVFVDDVENGLNCGCICPGCREDLVAKNGGSINEHHFAHYNGTECVHGYETSVHLFFKKLFENISKIDLPQLDLEPYWSDRFFRNPMEMNILQDSKILPIETIFIKEVFIEKMFSDIIPDITIVDYNNKFYFVEVVVTNNISNLKFEKLKSLGIPTLVINVPKDFDLSSLHGSISGLLEWKYHPLAEDFVDIATSFSTIKEFKYPTFFYNCPKKINGKTHKEDCAWCQYKLKYTHTHAVCFADILRHYNNDSYDFYHRDDIFISLCKKLLEHPNRSNIYDLWAIQGGKDMWVKDILTGLVFRIKGDPNRYKQVWAYHTSNPNFPISHPDKKIWVLFNIN